MTSSCDSSVALCRGPLGAGHPACAGALLGLAQIAESEGDWDEAQRLLDERRVIVLDVFGTDSVHDARDLAQRSLLAEGRGDLEAALGVAEDALEEMAPVFGDSHPELARRNGRISVLQGRLGNHEEARRYHARVLTQCLEFGGPRSACAVTHRSNLGDTLLALERDDEAEPELREALAAGESVYGHDHRICATALAGLGRIDLRQGRHEPAKQRLRAAVDAFGSERTAGWAITTSALARALSEAPGATEADAGEARERAERVLATDSELHEDVHQWLTAQ